MSMPRWGKRVLKILAILFGAVILLVVALALFLLQGFRMHMPDCEKGPLLSIQECQKDHATYTWQGSGWWFSLAKGPVEPTLCADMRNNTPEFDVRVHKDRFESLSPIDCAVVMPGQTYCYATQQLSSNGNSRIFNVLATDATCQSVTFFRGSKVTLENGVPKRVREWSNAYPGIADIVDGASSPDDVPSKY